MKKKLMKLAFAAALAVAAGVTAYHAQDKETLSDLVLANVEALAGGENTGGDHVNDNDDEVFKKGYAASTYKLYIPEFNMYTEIPCCKYTGNKYSACSATDVCP